MSFNLNFNICQSDCENLIFTDTTGEYIDGVDECCKTGYGYNGNPTRDQVDLTNIDVTYPNGTTQYLGIDFGYVPPLYACDSFTITATGGNGSIAITVAGASIGSALEIIDTAQMVQDLVNSINGGTCQHNYIASFTYDVLTGWTITICDMCGGTYSNGKILGICLFDTTADKTELVLSGANVINAWCFDLTSSIIDGTGIDNCFIDGVYTFTFHVEIDEGGEEPTLYSVTKKFLFDCMSQKCLRELILLATKPNCPCNGKDLHDKIQLHRTNIESAHAMFDNCEYDCANELIQETQGFCEDVCLDCE